MESYKKAGVDIEAGYEVVQRIQKHVSKTLNNSCIGTIGGFGGIYDLGQENLENPCLVSGCDGVGTKLLLYKEKADYTNVGYDLVAMSVNDVLVQGAKPLFFLDYIACGKNEPEVIETIVKSVSDACLEAKCALIGGETAEMPGMYQVKDYDLAGFCVGIIDKKNLIMQEKVKPGDILIGVESNGLHSNGFSLIRKIFFNDNNYELNHQFSELDCSLIEELTKPTKIYVEEVQKVLKSDISVHSMSHITGGGYEENLKRSLNGHGCEIYTENIRKQPIFKLVSEIGKIEYQELYNYLNMGIGYVFVIDSKDEEKILNLLGTKACKLGKVKTEKGIELLN